MKTENREVVATVRQAAVILGSAPGLGTCPVGAAFSAQQGVPADLLRMSQVSHRL